MARIPEMLIFGLIQPVMFVVLFTYVFGGSISIGGSTDPQLYKEFLMAGIFAQTVTFATAGAGAGIADDMHKGLIDRFRSLPMARGAVLTGRTLADLVQTTLTLVVLAGVALLVGWRTHENFGKVICGFLLLLLLGYAFSWIGALIGLSVRTPEAATSGGADLAVPADVHLERLRAGHRHADVPPARRRVESVQRHRGGGPRAVRQHDAGRAEVRHRGLADGAPDHRLDHLVGADHRGLPDPRGPQVPPAAT